MRKTLVVAVLVAAVGILAVGAFAFAQGPNPPDQNGTGFMGSMHAWMQKYEDVIHQPIADALGMSVADFEAAHDGGKSLAVLADEHKVPFDKVQEAMKTGRDAAIKLAVADGVITQAQAEWMLQRMQNMPGFGQGTMGRGMRGMNGMRGQGNGSGCPMDGDEQGGQLNSGQQRGRMQGGGPMMRGQGRMPGFSGQSNS